jgi:hypothetical protein
LGFAALSPTYTKATPDLRLHFAAATAKRTLFSGGGSEMKP